jgi:peroxisomal 2,4-dienoyl-CoA reductase
MSDFRRDLVAGRVALVTGGGTGIGKQIARTLGAHGAALAICARRLDVLEATAAELEAEGSPCLALRCDVRRPDEVDAVMRGVLARYGRLDIVVNNAAGNFPAPIAGISPNGFKAVVDIDLLGTYHVSRAAFLAWLRDHGGAIVNISAPFERLGVAFQSHVAAAKAGVDSLTRTCAVEWGPHGVRVNAIAPGAIANTEGLARVAASPLGGAGSGSSCPLGFVGEATDIANCALFLVSDAARYLTGQWIAVDGGSSVDLLKLARRVASAPGPEA